MNDISSAVAEAIKKRATSATLGTYLFFWMTYHWQGLYATFFVDQTLIYKTQHGLLKNEYVDKYFFGINGVWDWQFYLGIIVPALLTYIFIWHLPHTVLIRAYRQEQRHKVHRRIVKAEEEMKLQKAEESLAKQEKQTLQAEIHASEKKKEASEKDPTILWNDEITYLNPAEKELLRQVLRCIYEYHGRLQVSSEDGWGYEFELSPNALRFGDSRSLVDIVEKGTMIELTKKGKYFASKFEGEL